MASFDIKQIAGFALNSIDSVLAHWVPDGSYQGAEYLALNPSRADSHKGSFSVNRNTGAWADFADDSARGGDLVALVAYLERSSQLEACKRLAAFLGVQPNELPPTKTKPAKKPSNNTWQVIMPVPANTESQCPTEHYKNGKPSAVWEYRNQQGALLMKVMRFDINKQGERAKDYRPLTYCKAADGSGSSWRWQQPPSNRPLYGLHKLTDTQSPILFTEGEKAADFAQALLPAYLSLSWPGGGKALDKADFSPVAGRNVLLWPDNDEAGRQCMDKLAKQLAALGCRVSFLNIGVFGTSWPQKADAADAEQHGFNAERFTELASNGQLFTPYLQESANKAASSKKGQQITEGAYVVNDAGVFYRNQDDDSGDETPMLRVCDRLDVLGQTRDIQGLNWGMMVRFKDPDGAIKEWNISRELLATEGGAELLRQLYSRGLRAEPGQAPRRRLVSYLQTANPSQRYTLVNKVGWHGEAYLTRQTTYGQIEEPLYFYSDTPDTNTMQAKGDLNGWKKNVAQYCVNNPRLMFAVSVAFAGPLLHLVGMETTGFHFYGDSSKGKSTAIFVASSVCGSPDYHYKWRATDNALEGIAAAHNDGLLVLDEMSQCSPMIVGDVAYMLGNGKSKSRSNDKGGVKSQPDSWRLMYLSTGEVTLAQHMGEVGKKPKAGQEVRLLSIPADSGSGYGLFNDLHSFASGKTFAEYLDKIAITENYGTAFPAFLDRLCASDLHKLSRRIRDEFVKFNASLPEDASGQVGRTANKFALVGFAGELATKAGITGWQVGDAMAAAKEIFNAWVNDRGGVGNQEDQQILAHVRLHFELYGESAYTRWDRDDSTVDDHGIRTLKRCGFRKTLEDSNALGDAPSNTVSGNACSETVFYVTPEAFKSEICKGYKHTKVTQLLAECGALMRGADGRYSLSERLPGYGRQKKRVYVIKPHLIPDYEDKSESQEDKAA